MDIKIAQVSNEKYTPYDCVKIYALTGSVPESILVALQRELSANKYNSAKEELKMFTIGYSIASFLIFVLMLILKNPVITLGGTIFLITLTLPSIAKTIMLDKKIQKHENELEIIKEKYGDSCPLLIKDENNNMVNCILDYFTKNVVKKPFIYENMAEDLLLNEGDDINRYRLVFVQDEEDARYFRMNCIYAENCDENIFDKMIIV